MPITRCRSHNQIPVPLPSPIPTGRGTRSAANEIFSQFLEKTLQLPELTLPGPHLPPAPAEIDLRSLPLASADLLKRSAKEFGAFRIRCHGIAGNELRTVADEAESVFEDSKNVVIERKERGGEMIPCVRSSNGSLEFTPQQILGNQTHRKFWYIYVHIHILLVLFMSMQIIVLDFHLFRFVLLIFWILNRCTYFTRAFRLCIFNLTCFKCDWLRLLYSPLAFHHLCMQSCKLLSFFTLTIDMLKK